MTENKANKLIDDLLKEVYKDNGSCLCLVGNWENGKLQYIVGGVAGDVYVLDAMVDGVLEYQQEQYAAIDENNIPRLTGIKIDKEAEKVIKEAEKKV